MGKNKKKSMGIVPSSYYEMNVDQVILPEDDAPPTDVDGNAVYDEVLKTAEEILEQARNIGVNTIGEELSKSEADLGVIDLSGGGGVVAEEEKKDDNLSQKQKQQKGGYNGWWWWRK
jgi:hypothetical protein